MDQYPATTPVTPTQTPPPQPSTPQTQPTTTQTPPNPTVDPTQAQQTKKELESTTLAEFINLIERRLIRLLSIVLLIHGSIGLYDELIQIFFVFPHIPKVLQALNYSQSAFEAVYRRSVILGTTALLETIYGMVLLNKKKSFAHKIHLASGIGLLILSYISLQLLSPINLESAGNIPQPPTFTNLLQQPSFESALFLFQH